MAAIATAFPSGSDTDSDVAQPSEVRGVDMSDWADDGKRTNRTTRARDGSAKAGRKSEWYSGGHSLQRQSDGHFYANGTVQGTTTQFLVDTGASVIALTGADARAAGLTWSNADIVPIGSGASGTVFGVSTMIDEVEIGGLTQRNVRAVIIPEGLEISLLGQSFLSEIKSVEIAGDRMVWKAN
jgi:aspartyl protease family protein